MSPEVGKAFGSSDRVDFLIHSRASWGVELVRNSSKLEEHLQRFQSRHEWGREDGLYFPLVQKKAVKDWVVLDFCLKGESVTIRKQANNIPGQEETMNTAADHEK